MIFFQSIFQRTNLSKHFKDLVFDKSLLRSDITLNEVISKNIGLKPIFFVNRYAYRCEFVAKPCKHP